MMNPAFFAPLFATTQRFKKLATSCWLVLALLSTQPLTAQVYPVQATTQLVPPYSVYLSDYATPGNEKLRLILLQRDLTQPSYQVRLVLRVELNGREILRTANAYTPAPINLTPGTPTIIAGADLAPYLDSRNLDFTGYNRQQYEATRALPEGSYQISFTAYDYRRPQVQVSNAGTSFYYLAKNEPPLINFPACGSRLPQLSPQQVIFSWLPRNTASPNAANQTQYELSLYETRPEGRNPNDVVLSSPAIFSTRTTAPQYVYTLADPPLQEGMQYVWRVRATDEGGRDAYRNNGYSEVCTFTYGGIDPGRIPGTIENLQAEAQTDRRARVWWPLGQYEAYRLSYRKTGQDNYQWFTQRITRQELLQAGQTQAEIKLFGLEPETQYEARVQVQQDGYYGAYSPLVTFTTLQTRQPVCGQPASTTLGDPARPLRQATTGMLVQVDDMQMQLGEVLHLGEGWYKGTGRISWDFFGGAVFAVVFERLYIDQDLVAGRGAIDFVSHGVAQQTAQQIANAKFNQKDKQQAQNREQWQDVVFSPNIILYDQLEITEIINTPEGLQIKDGNGGTTLNTEIPALLSTAPEKAIIIQDKNGDQYVVQKDAATGETKVTKVEGGGLQATNGITLTQQEEDIIRKALKQLESEYKSKLRNFTSNTPITDYAVATAIVFYADESNTTQGHKLIASGLQVNDQNVLEFLRKATEQNITAEQQIQDVKTALIAIIAKNLKEIYATITDLEQQLSSLNGDEKSLIYRRGGSQRAQQPRFLAQCFDKKDEVIVRDYIQIAKVSTSQTASDFLTNTLTALAGIIVSSKHEVILSSVLCPILHKKATQYYVRARLEDEGYAEKGKSLSQCAAEAYTKAISLPGTIELKAYTALLYTGLCLTAKNQCEGRPYWVQFSYGATNALLQELDVVAIADGILLIVEKQVKNKIACIKKGGLTYLVVSATSYQQAIHSASQCLLGVDMTVEEWQNLYAIAEGYIKQNFTDPYLHGQATIFVVSLMVPITKLSVPSKLKLLNKLKNVPTFENKVEDLAKIAKAVEEGKDVRKVVDDLAKGVGKTQLLAKLYNLNVPNVKNWINRLDDAADAPLLKKIDDLATSDPAKLSKLDDLYKNMKAPAGKKGTGDFTVQVDGKNLHYDKNGFPDFTLETPTVSGRKINFQSQSLTGNSADMAAANEWALKEFGATNFQKVPNSTQCRIKIGNEWVEHTWHHHQDGRSMFPVKSTLHSKAQHSGGAAVIDRGLQGFFNSPMF